jgi:drug/metabolite transporter (DMT)-like permease
MTVAGRRAVADEHRSARLGIGAVVAAVLVLSAGSTMVRSAGAPGSVVAFWRLLIAAAGWHVISALKGRWPDGATWRRVAPTGLLFGLDLVLFFTAVTLTRIANVEFIGTLAPVLVVPAAAMLLGERVNAAVVALGTVALAGIAVVVLGSASTGADGLLGDALAGGALVCWSAYLLLTKRLRQHVDTAAFMTVMTSVAIVAVLPVALASHTFLGAGIARRHLGFSVRGLFRVPLHGWVLIAVMAVASGLLSHGILAWSQRRVPVSTISLIQVAQPALSASWAYLALGETVRPVQVAGMAVVLLAVGGIVLRASRLSGSARSAGSRRRALRSSAVGTGAAGHDTANGELGGTPG